MRWGIFEKCIDVIYEKKATESYKSNRDFLEFSYRLGRAYHEWGKPEQAIPYYELTIKNGATLNCILQLILHLI